MTSSMMTPVKAIASMPIWIVTRWRLVSACASDNLDHQEPKGRGSNLPVLLHARLQLRAADLRRVQRSCRAFQRIAICKAIAAIVCGADAEPRTCAHGGNDCGIVCRARCPAIAAVSRQVKPLAANGK